MYNMKSSKYIMTKTPMVQAQIGWVERKRKMILIYSTKTVLRNGRLRPPRDGPGLNPHE